MKFFIIFIFTIYSADVYDMDHENISDRTAKLDQHLDVE